MKVLKKKNHIIPLQDIYQDEMKWGSQSDIFTPLFTAPCSPQHYQQERRQKTQMSIHRGMDRESVVHPYIPCIVFLLENEGKSTMSDNVDELGGCYAP